MEPSDPKLNTVVDGRYRLEERLAAGGMGVVYRAAEVDSGRAVAVKFLHEAFASVPDLVKRFQREVAAMSRVAHPHMVGVLDSGVSGSVPYLVMDFQAGRPLADVLERGALAGPRAVAIARQVLAGVGHAHENGVVHRDLKPDNIILLGEVGKDFVKILDFGLAKLVNDGQTQLTNTGFALGTPGYMAPEQARGTNADERADIYAVGVILYQMVVGRKPFVADSPMAVLRMHMDDPPVPPQKAAPDRAISDELQAAILRAMEKSPERRFATAEAFSQALAQTPEGGASELPLLDLSMVELAHSRTVVARKKKRLSLSFSLPRWRVPRAVRWLALAALVGGVVAIGWARLSRREQSRLRQRLDGAVGAAKETLGQLTDVPVKPGSPLKAQPKPASDDDDDDSNDEPVVPHNTPGAQLEAQHARTAPSKKSRVADAARLLAAGKTDDAIQLLYQLRHQSPHNADVALLLGHAYFHKLWRTDGLREYDDALALRPSLRHDARLVRNTVSALDGATFKLARSVIRKRLGVAALPDVKRAARDARSPKTQKRAARLAQELARRR
jgi:serine/threonine-protein kinase